MGWIILIVAVVVVLYLIQQHGKRLSDELGVKADTHSVREALNAAKRRQDAKRVEGQNSQKWRKAGKVIRDERFGTAMKDTLNDMTEECPECGGPVWNQADKCGHCGASLSAK